MTSKQVPRSVIAERYLPPLPCPRSQHCLQALDDPGRPILDRVFADGTTTRLAGNADKAGGDDLVLASDARAMRDGGLRYLTWHRGATVLVTVRDGQADKRQRGGAPRPMLLGGPSRFDPTNEAGTFRFDVVGKGGETAEQPPFWAQIVETIAGSGSCPWSSGPASCRAVARIPIVAERVLRPRFLAADGSRAGVVIQRGTRLWFWRYDVRSKQVVTWSLPSSAVLAAALDLSRIAIRTEQGEFGALDLLPPRTVVGTRFRSIEAAAFDPKGRFLVLAGRASAQSRTELLHVRLPEGAQRSLARLRFVVDRLEISPCGDVVVASGSTDRAQSVLTHAATVGTSNSRTTHFPLPSHTERVVFDPR